MASNPIKRRARQSFVLGFLISLVIMAVVVLVLIGKINLLNEQNKKLSVKGPKIKVYTLKDDIEEGDPITPDDLISSTMQLDKSSKAIQVENYIDPTIFSVTNEETGEEEEVTYTAKVKLQAGTVVTMAMLQEDGIKNDERLMEYSMIVLPSQLNNGDYIDIRLRLANGTETVVLAKKRVEQSTESTIWMKMTEIEIETMNSAIVDAYLATGSQLRATVYTNPLMQEPALETYPVNDKVFSNIYANPNILAEAVNDLSKRWTNTTDNNADISDFNATRRVINSYIQSTTPTEEEQATAVESGYETETQNQSTARGDYVSALEGTGTVGTTYN